MNIDQITLGIITNIGVNYFTQFTAPIIQKAFKFVLHLKPELKNNLNSIQNTKNVEDLFREMIGVIDAQAGKGTIDIDSAFIEALKGIRFNHASGTVTINGTTISAPVIKTGGGAGGVGRTIISETELKTDKTSIKVKGKRSSIKISGDANITQM